jgi:hypothetical protein
MCGGMARVVGMMAGVSFSSAGKEGKGWGEVEVLRGVRIMLDTTSRT